MRLAKIVLLTGITFLFSESYGQKFKWEATLEDSVTADGFYNVILPPGIGANIKSDYSDIRIVDEENYQIPFLLKSEEPYFIASRFKEYEVVSKEIKENCCTKLTIKNEGKKAINNICLVLKNSNALKVMRVVGSDDGENWFAIQRFSVFYNQYSEEDTKVVNYVHFPLTDYLYYRFDIMDRGYWDEERWAFWNEERWSYPVNILKVGYYESQVKEGKYQSVPMPTWTQKDSAEDKRTYVKINFKEDYTLDRIRFNVSGPRYFKREAKLAIKIKDYFQEVATVELNSYSLNEHHLPSIRGKQFYLIVSNEDNRPLQMESIETWQLTKYLKTYLELGHQYRLVYGDSLATSPVYDLRYFIDSIPEILPTLPINEIKRKDLQQDNVKAIKVIQWYEKPWVIWMAIGIVMALLVFLSIRMLKDMKKEEK